MSKTITITLAGVDYLVPKPNIGQTKEISRIFSGPASDISYDVLDVAFQRVQPKVDVLALEADFDEIARAVSDILIFAGMKKADPNPPAPPEGTG